MATILVIEDDSKTANAVCNGLRTEGYAADVARTGEEGDSLLRTEGFDLVVLDWMLPGRDGIEILKTLRARGAACGSACLLRRISRGPALTGSRRSDGRTSTEDQL